MIVSPSSFLVANFLSPSTSINYLNPCTLPFPLNDTNLERLEVEPPPQASLFLRCARSPMVQRPSPDLYFYLSLRRPCFVKAPSRTCCYFFLNRPSSSLRGPRPWSLIAMTAIHPPLRLWALPIQRLSLSRCFILSFHTSVVFSTCSPVFPPPSFPHSNRHLFEIIPVFPPSLYRRSS